MAKTAKKSNVRPNSNHIGVATLAHGHYIRPWQVIIFIVLVMFAGIIIIRLSHAATSEVVSTPLTEAELQQLSPSVTADLTSGVSSSTASPIQVSDTVLFSYTPVGVAGVDKVGFYVDGKLTTVATKRPYNLTFDSTRYPNGTYMLTAVAFDNSNKPLAAVKKTVEVNNDLSLIQRAGNIITYPFYVLTTGR